MCSIDNLERLTCEVEKIQFTVSVDQVIVCCATREQKFVCCATREQMVLEPDQLGAPQLKL